MVAVDSTDFSSRETGLSSFTVYRSRNGGAAAVMTTPTINETDASNMPGVYELLVDEDTTLGSSNDTEEMCFHITHAGMAPVTRTIELYRPETTEGQTLAVANSVASADAVQISGDSTAADNLETMLDGTGGQTLSLGQLSISRSDSAANILLAGSGAGDGVAFTRAGSGNPFDTNFMSQINAEVDTAITDASLATAAALTTVDTVVDAIKVVTDNLPESGALTTIDSNIDAILLDTGTTLPASLATIDGNVDAILLDTGTTLPAALATIDSNVDAILVDTSTSIPADIAALDVVVDRVEADTQDIQSRLPAALVSGKMDSDVTAISGDTVAADRLEAAMDSVVTGTAQTGTLSTTQMTTDLSETTDDHYIGRLITFKTGALAGQQTDITDYTGTSGLLTFTALTEAPGNGDTFVIT
jgi:hypothetical protein